MGDGITGTNYTDLEDAAREMVAVGDVVDELDCSCYERAPCETCQFQSAFARLVNALSVPALPTADQDGAP